MGRKRSYATLYRTRRRQDIAALTYDCCIRTVLGSLCNALGQCRRTKTAGEQRKSALAKKEGQRERRRASTSSFFPRLLPFFFSPLSSLSWTSLLFTCYDLHWTWLKRRRWTRIWQVHLVNQPCNWRRITYFHVILLGYKFACIFCTLYRIVKVLHNMISFWLPQMKRPVSCLAATPQCACMSWMPTMKLLSLVLQATM